MEENTPQKPLDYSLTDYLLGLSLSCFSKKLSVNSGDKSLGSEVNLSNSDEICVRAENRDVCEGGNEILSPRTGNNPTSVTEGTSNSLDKSKTEPVGYYMLKSEKEKVLKYFEMLNNKLKSERKSDHRKACVLDKDKIITMCLNCGECYSKENNYESHILVYMTEIKFQCHKCGEEILADKQLLAHPRKVREWEAHCKHCAENEKLIRLHRRNKKCEHCGHLFSRYTDFIHHHYVHFETPHECDICAERVYIHACELCQETFLSKSELLGHMIVGHAPVNVQNQDTETNNTVHCKKCGKKFCNKYFFKKHRKSLSCNNGEPVLLECEYCTQKYYSSLSLSNHFMKKHYKLDVYHCKLCDGKFHTLTVFLIHRKKGFCKIVTKDSQVNLSESNCSKLYKCPQCKKNFFMKRTLKLHIQKFHSSLKIYNVISNVEEKAMYKIKCSKKKLLLDSLVSNGKKIGSEEAKTKHPRPKGKFLLDEKMTFTLCHKCGKSVNQNKDHQTHKLIHLRELRFQCAKCGVKIDSETQLIAHSKVIDNKVVQCKYCVEMYRFSRLQLKRIQCNLCECVLNNYAEFLNHHKSHFSEDSHKCDICEDKFYVCEHCDKVFIHADNWQKHRKSQHQTLSKKYTCKCRSCGRIFKFKSVYKKHLTKSSKCKNEFLVKPHKYEYCNKKFHNYEGLTKHCNKYHNKGKTCQCELCGEIFDTLGLMSQHKQTHL